MGGEKGLRNRCTIKFTGTIQYVDGEVHHPLGQRAHPSYPQSVRHTLRGGGSGVEVTLPPLGSLPSPNALHNGGGGGVERRVFWFGRLLQLERGASSLAEGGGVSRELSSLSGSPGMGGGLSRGIAKGSFSSVRGAAERGRFQGGGGAVSRGGGGSTLTGFADSISKFNILG